MGRLIRIESTFIVTDEGNLYHNNLAKFDKQLRQLSGGVYKILIEKKELEIDRMRKFYFVMESALAKHLGYRKEELHVALKKEIGQIITPKGRKVYESIAKVATTERMMERILEFQEFAARNFDYTCEPYRDTDNGQ